MKESTLVQMQNKIETLAQVNNKLVMEVDRVKELAIGLMELVKQLPDYDLALQVLKDSITKQNENNDKTEEDDTGSTD